jgi:hypothetical protein
MARDKRLDDAISRWLEEAAPSQLPERVLESIFERTRASKRQIGWRALLGRIRINRFTPALGGVTVIVLAAALALSYYAGRQESAGSASPAPLPATPDAWSRVLIDSRFRTAQVDTDSLAASPRGLLALLGEIGSNAFELAVSTDGLTWLRVPANQHPPLGNNVELIQLIGTERGFMAIVGYDVWTTPDGFTWERLTGPEDPDLRQGEILDAASGGQGFVAVGTNNTAWYSTDGSDWSLADVPPLPAEFGGPGYTGQPPTVTMYQVATSGEVLVAWGYASADNGDETVGESVVWTSRDGQTWTNVHGPQIGSVTLIGGPGGFVATGVLFDRNADQASGVAFFSSDGQNWERATNDIESGAVDAAAASSSGFVVVGGDGRCFLELCRDAEAAIWISRDGRSWSRLLSSDLFRVNAPSDPAATRGADATSVVAWGSRFAVGGHYDGKPVIWISRSEPTGNGGTAIPTPAAGAPAPEPAEPHPVAFAGNWEATDPPPDSSHLTMELIALPSGSYGVTARDDVASVCGGVSSTTTVVADAIERDTIVMRQPEYACDDGNDARALSGPPLEEQLQNLGFTNDASRDELQDSLGLVWSRVAMGP